MKFLIFLCQKVNRIWSLCIISLVSHVLFYDCSEISCCGMRKCFNSHIGDSRFKWKTIRTFGNMARRYFSCRISWLPPCTCAPWWHKISRGIGFRPYSPVVICDIVFFGFYLYFFFLSFFSGQIFADTTRPKIVQITVTLCRKLLVRGVRNFGCFFIYSLLLALS